MSEQATCEAHVWRGTLWDPTRETCGRPAKGMRTMHRGGGIERPACGIHMKAKDPMWWADLDEGKKR